MTDSLTATGSSLANIRPVIGQDNTISAINVQINLSYSAADGTPVAGRSVEFDIWPLLNQDQKDNLNDVQATISQYIYTTFLA